MKTPLSRSQARAARHLLWISVLACLPAVACFRSLDPKKLTCTSGSTNSCPTGYYCSAEGKCTEGAGATGGSAAGSSGTDASTDAPVSSPDGGGTAGATGDDGGAGTGGVAGISGTGGAAGAGSADNGTKCSAGTDCKSGECWDGVCCDLKCDGNCETCATGSCLFTTTPRKACAGSGKCAGVCDKGNQKECTFDKTTVCAAQSCVAGERSEKSICDGKGNCPTQVKTTCDPKQCAADGTDCVTCTDETSATTCAGGRCGPTVNNCGHTVQCPPSCSGTGETCGGGGKAGFCGCTSATSAQTCGTSNCGTKLDNCGKTVSCGTCTGYNTCGGGGQANMCGCTPNTSACNGRACGTAVNNCGTTITCGIYAGGCQTAYQCNTSTGQCTCTPNCTNKCGGVTDGCAGFCTGSCGSGQTCNNGTCCTPTAQATACGSRVCGTVSDGCGGTWPCGGSCPTGQSCDSSGNCAGCISAATWGFESDSTSPWTATLYPEASGTNAVTYIRSAKHTAASGSRALKLQWTLGTMYGSHVGGVAAKLCTSGTVSLASRTISFDLASSVTFWLYVRAWGPSGVVANPGASVIMGDGNFQHFSFELEGAATHVGIYFDTDSVPESMSGTMFIDNVEF